MAIVLALVVGCAGLTYQPPLLPIAITVAPDGSIEVSAEPEIATPIGTFSLSIPLANFSVPPGETLVVLLFLATAFADNPAQHGQGDGNVQLARDYRDTRGVNSSAALANKMALIMINSSVKMRFLYNGNFLGVRPEDNSNEVKLTLGKGVTGIRIQNVEKDPTIRPRFSRKHVTILPTPKGVTIPTGSPESWPVPKISSCTTSGGTFMVTCAAASTGHYTYRWFDRGRPIGKPGNSLTATLTPGAHSISVTATTSSNFSFSSPACVVTVPTKVNTTWCSSPADCRTGVGRAPIWPATAPAAMEALDAVRRHSVCSGTATM
jgi:hypothetical protein